MNDSKMSLVECVLARTKNNALDGKGACPPRRISDEHAPEITNFADPGRSVKQCDLQLCAQEYSDNQQYEKREVIP